MVFFHELTESSGFLSTFLMNNVADLTAELELWHAFIKKQKCKLF